MRHPAVARLDGRRRVRPGDGHRRLKHLADGVLMKELPVPTTDVPGRVAQAVVQYGLTAADRFASYGVKETDSGVFRPDVFIGPSPTISF